MEKKAAPQYCRDVMMMVRRMQDLGCCICFRYILLLLLLLMINNSNNNNSDNHIAGTIEDFYNLFTVQELSPTRTLKWLGRNGVQITCNTLSAYHVQHGMCHVVQKDSSAVKCDRAEITFTLALFYWLRLLTNEGGEETIVPGENP